MTMDLVWVGWKPVVYVVDTYTCYEKAVFISDKLATGLWTVFVEVFAAVYCSYPDVLRVDPEPSFLTSAFRDSTAK